MFYIAIKFALLVTYCFNLHSEINSMKILVSCAINRYELN